MKALRSLLARQVLADPRSRAILREAAASVDGTTRSTPAQVELELNGKTQFYQPVLVRKAA